MSTKKNEEKKKTHVGPERRQTRRLGLFLLLSPNLTFPILFKHDRTWLQEKFLVSKQKHEEKKTYLLSFSHDFAKQAKTTQFDASTSGKWQKYLVMLKRA